MPNKPGRAISQGAKNPPPLPLQSISHNPIHNNTQPTTTAPRATHKTQNPNKHPANYSWPHSTAQSKAIAEFTWYPMIIPCSLNLVYDFNSKSHTQTRTPKTPRSLTPLPNIPLTIPIRDPADRRTCDSTPPWARYHAPQIAQMAPNHAEHQIYPVKAKKKRYSMLNFNLKK